ncbi:MAG: YheC/YheD family protein [Bacillota bacterium]
MKQLYYDLNGESWYHTYQGKDKIYLGKYFSVPYRDTHPENYQSFPFNVKDSKAGPLVGILASPKKEGFIGNIGLFKRLQLSLAKKGGNSIVFTPEQLTDDGMEGYCFLPAHRSWIKIKAPLPDIIYNRLYSLEDEEDHLERVKNLADLYQIPIFNPRYFDKWELYLQVKSHEDLVEHLPRTELFTEKTLEEMLFTFGAVYVKKRKSKKGLGLSYIYSNGNSFILKTTSAKTYLFPSINKLVQYFLKEDKLQSYIVQEAISTLPFEGKKFDYRILAHAKDRDFSITGIGVRVANTQQVTTHVPAGGRIAALEELPIELDVPALSSLINQCGKHLSTFYDNLSEFSADIGVTAEGKHYLYELNAKPMDFDETAIKQSSTEKLTDLFIEKTNKIKDFSV